MSIETIHEPHRTKHESWQGICFSHDEAGSTARASGPKRGRFPALNEPCTAVFHDPNMFHVSAGNTM